MMIAAIDTCSIAMPSTRMPMTENITANGTIIAATKPARSPRKTITKPPTTTKVCATFESAELTGLVPVLPDMSRSRSRSRLAGLPHNYALPHEAARRVA